MSAPIEAPRVRLVNALTSKKAPDKFMAALSEADDFVREIDGLRELQTQIQELEAERDGFRESAMDLSTILQSAFADIAKVKAERDDLAERLDSSAEARRITLAELADAKRELANLRREADVWAGKATGAL